MTHAYQSPAFILEHLAADAGVAAVTSNNATVAGQGVERLIDSRTAKPLWFASALGDHDIEIDFGVTTVVQSLFIPAGHTLGTTTVEVFSGASSPAASSEGTKAATADAPFQFDWVNGTGARFWRVAFNASGAWRLPELVLGSKTRTMVRGPEPDWRTPVQSAVNIGEFPAFEAALVLGAERRVWELDFRRVSDADDLDVFDTLQNLGRARPFAFLPPDSHYGWTWVRLVEDFDYRQSFPAPGVSVQYDANARLIEQL